jgi:outer membrane immunogenic protein
MLYHQLRRLFAAGIVAAAFCGAPALAADMPVKAAPVPMFNWTGLYVGGTAGYAWGSYTGFGVGVGGASGNGPAVDSKGFVGGATLGYNWQVNNWLFGFETDFSNGPRGSAAQGTVGPLFNCGTGKCVADVNYFGTARARLGVTSNQWLLYATGGLAYGRFHGGIENSVFMGDSTRTGWTAGAGVEYTYNPQWSTKIEYLHVDLGDAKFGVTGAGLPYHARGDFDVVRFGLNYKFGGDPWGKAPVSAKY